MTTTIRKVKLHLCACSRCNAMLDKPGETGDQSTLTRQTFLSVPQSNLAMFRHRSCAHDRIEQWPIE